MQNLLVKVSRSARRRILSQSPSAKICYLLSGWRFCVCFFFSSRRRHTRSDRDWSSDVCSSDLGGPGRQFVSRNAPSLLNGGLGLFYLFWDGQVARAGFRPPPPGPAGEAFVTPAGPLPPRVPHTPPAPAAFPPPQPPAERGRRGGPRPGRKLH